MDDCFFISMTFSFLYLWMILSCGIECTKGKKHCQSRVPMSSENLLEFLLHLSCNAATLELWTEAVEETGPAVSLLSSATDYYLHNITNDRAWCGASTVLTSSLASKLALINWAQCAKGYLARFQSSEPVTMLQRALALSVTKGVGQFFPSPVLLRYLLGFLGSPGGWVVRKALRKNS